MLKKAYCGAYGHTVRFTLWFMTAQLAGAGFFMLLHVLDVPFPGGR